MSKLTPLAIICLCISPAFAAERASSVPAEERRLSTAVFREGLKKRGLLDILELHLKDYPPQSGAEQLLLEREARLSEFRDAGLPAIERAAALEKANAALNRLIQENPEDQRRFQWMFELAHSLIFEQGAPYATNILYTGGSEADRAKLAQISEQALATVRTLIERLEAEFTRIDGLTPGQFARLENTPYMADLDRIAPNADYLLLWALFYDSLPRKPDDAARSAQLNEILEHLSRDSLILKAPQEQTHVQIPATVLAGTTYRHLGDYHNARLFLDRARSLAERLADEKEKLSVQWAVVLADIEGIRADRDDQRWPAAKERIDKFRERFGSITKDQPVDAFGLQMVAALLERSVNMQHAQGVEKAGREEEAADLRRKAWQGLAQLAAANPARRDELFAAIDRTAHPQTPAAQRDPVEIISRVAALLKEAEEKGDAGADTALSEAIKLAQSLLEQQRTDAELLMPQVLRLLAVAQYRRGDTASSANFTKLACSYPAHPDAQQAAVYGVQLAAKLNQQKDAPLAAKQQYRAALECLLDKFPQSEQAEYWRFFYAQLLDELGEHDEASAQYALIKPTHKQYIESAYFRLRSLAQALQKQAESGEVKEVYERADAISTAYRDLVARIQRLDAAAPQNDSPETDNLLADGLVLTAEAAILQRIHRHQYALDLLADFESRHSEQSELLGRVWLVRLTAYHALDNAAKRDEAVSSYVAADPKGAGRTLQRLYNAAAQKAEESRQRSAATAYNPGHQLLEEVRVAGAAQAAEQAKTALLFAEQLVAWADAHGENLTADEKKYLLVQLGEASVRAWNPLKARAAFAGILPSQSPQLPSSELDLRIMLGNARALAGLDNCMEALPIFNQLATGLQPTSPMRWEALLGDLFCRTTLGEPAEGVLKVIEQQKLLYPDLGGPAFAGRFEFLRRENERRLGSNP